MTSSAYLIIRSRNYGVGMPLVTRKSTYVVCLSHLFNLSVLVRCKQLSLWSVPWKTVYGDFTTVKIMLLHPLIPRILGLLVLISPTKTADPMCFQPGFCAGSFALDEPPTADDIECLLACQNHPECQWFSFFGQVRHCALLTECKDFNPEQTNVISGARDCEIPPQICGQPGKCEETALIFSNVSVSIDACGNRCQLWDDCRLYSYDPSTDACQLFTDCDNNDDSRFVTNARHCNIQDVPVLLLVNGFPAFHKVSLLDLSQKWDEDQSDISLPNEYIIGVEGASGFVYQEKPTICGGEGYGNVWQSCYQLDPESQEWVEIAAMSIQRFQAPSLSFKPTGFDQEMAWILGGIGNESQYYASTEILQEGTFSPGPDLPIPLHGGCALTLDQNEVLVIGGSSDTDLSLKSTWSYSWSEGQWTSGPELNIGRLGHACLVKDGKIIVAGGLNADLEPVDSVEILENGVWVEMANLPFPISGASLFNLNGEVILLGGVNAEGKFLDSVFHMKMDQWTELTETFDYPREFFNVFQYHI